MFDDVDPHTDVTSSLPDRCVLAITKWFSIATVACVIHAQTHSARLPCLSDGAKSTDNAGRVPFVPVAVQSSALRILIKYYVTSYNLKFPDNVTPLSPADWEDYVVLFLVRNQWC